jgi:iron complex outermembrane recepter protein
MKTVQDKKGLSRASNAQLAFRLTPLAAACAFAVFSAGSVQAQQADQGAQKVEGIVVTGIRKGIEDAISVKKNADSIVEAISAEDIGKLPDTSIAESIARLPGVSAQRNQGRSQTINIRGTPADFATGLLNGREQASTGDSRTFEYDQYPSELFGSVVVHKTPEGALMNQGLSGTIDQRVVRPLDFAKRTAAVGYRKQKLGVGLGAGEGTGDRFNLSYVDQFADRRLGIALGFARLDETTGTTQRFESWGGTGYNTSTTDPKACGDNNATPPIPRTAACVEVPNGFNAWTDQTKQKRDGTMAVIQFKPTKDFESTFDLFYSKFDIDKATKGFQAPIRGGAGGYDPDGVLSAATIVTGTGNSIAPSGTLNNFKAVIRNDTTGFNDKLTSYGWNNKLKVGESWTAGLDLSKSTAKRTGAILETTAGLAGNGNTNPAGLDSISWTGFDGNNVGATKFTTLLNYTDRSKITLTDVQGWGGGPATPQAGYSKLPNIVDDVKSVRVNAKRDLPEGWLFSAADVGFNVGDREKTRAYVEGRLEIPTGGAFAGTTIPGSSTTVINGIPVATWDPRGSVGGIYQVAAKLVGDIANKDWTVKEKVNTFYTKLDIDSTLQATGTPVRGNVGLQVVQADQSSTAFNVDGSNCPSDVCVVRPVSDGTKYTDVLPSMNLAFDMGRDQTLRFAMGRQMARPNMNDMRASLGFGVDNTFLGGSPVLKGGAGNPTLKPYRANALDLSYEKYFGTKAYFSAATFYKHLQSFIVKRTELFDYAPFVNAGTPLPKTGPAAGSTFGFIERPVNGDNGNIKGIELAASLPFNMFAKPLDGFGTQISYSNTFSSVSLPATSFRTQNISGGKIPLPGLSKQVANITLYFEKAGFGARVSQRYRSDFVGEVTDIVGDRQLTTIKGEKVTDAQLSYEVQSGPVKGLSVLLQATNLGNAPFIRYQDTPANEVENTKYGKTYLFGLNYKL